MYGHSSKVVFSLVSRLGLRSKHFAPEGTMMQLLPVDPDIRMQRSLDHEVQCTHVVKSTTAAERRSRHDEYAVYILSMYQPLGAEGLINHV